MVAKVNLAEFFARFDDAWSPKVVGDINEQQVKLVKLRGEFLWHHHEHEDEMFLVVRGELRMRFRNRDVLLTPGEFIIVPHGVEHCPVAAKECEVVLIEPRSTRNTGEVQNERTVENLERLA